MPAWFFEAGHTAAEFSVRHMMVTHVRGHFKNVHGTLTFDEADPCSGSVEVQIDARGLWTGEPERDAHPRSADFLDVEHHPQIRINRHDFGVSWNSALDCRGRRGGDHHRCGGDPVRGEPLISSCIAAHC